MLSYFHDLNEKTCSALLGIALLLGLSLASYTAGAEQVVTMVGDPWPPFVEGKLGEDATSGIAVTIHNEIFSRLDNTAVRFPLIPWKRALKEVELGNYDGIGLLLKTAEREAYMVFSDPLLLGKGLVWSVADDQGKAFQWDSFADLENKRIGIVADYSYGASIDKLISEGRLSAVTGPSVEHLFSMLANGRIDLVLANEGVGSILARENSSVRILAADKATEIETFYIGISRKSPVADLIPDINRVLRELHAEGYIERALRGEQP